MQVCVHGFSVEVLSLPVVCTVTKQSSLILTASSMFNIICKNINMEHNLLFVATAPFPLPLMFSIGDERTFYVLDQKSLCCQRPSVTIYLW